MSVKECGSCIPSSARQLDTEIPVSAKKICTGTDTKLESLYWWHHQALTMSFFHFDVASLIHKIILFSKFLLLSVPRKMMNWRWMYVLGAFVNLCGLNCWKCQFSNVNMYPSNYAPLSLFYYFNQFFRIQNAFVYGTLFTLIHFLWHFFYLYDEQSVIARFCIFTQCTAILLFCAGLLR